MKNINRNCPRGRSQPRSIRNYNLNFMKREKKAERKKELAAPPQPKKSKEPNEEDLERAQKRKRHMRVPIQYNVHEFLKFLAKDGQKGRDW